MRTTRRDVMFGAIGAALVSTFPAVAGTRIVGGPAFGSSWRASIDGAADAEGLRGRIQRVVAEIDALFSPYRRDSDLSRFNAAQTRSWQPANPVFADVTREALRVADLTGGFFDPTVGPLVARLGFGPIEGAAASFREIEVENDRIRTGTPDATLDLCGIAKGYALDRIVAVFAAAGIARAVVDVGGEVKALGSHPDGRPWAVAISDPWLPGKARHIVALRGLALATSGHTANGVRGRVNASHIIDPHRKRPAVQSLLSVSVLDPAAMRADALATALCAAGPVAGPALARRLNIRALFIFEDGEQMTGGFDEHILI